jgi:hypothetical protein
MVDHFFAESVSIERSLYHRDRRSECLSRAIEQQVVIDVCRVYSSGRSHERKRSFKLEHWCSVESKEIMMRSDVLDMEGDLK